ncbi:MAG TPA: MerR family transcriptional regulator [Thermoanaerobaculia bacterium]|nr:MerR family transcriptional regulator [Thermoanaerobaculia bacterium]
MPHARLTISEVHRRTGIPVTTLRFYEKELPDFFQVEKTTGGHRRYTEASVAQFQAVRRMVDQEGMRLGQLRDRLTPAADSGDLRRHVDLLLSVQDAMTQQIDELAERIRAIEAELSVMKGQTAPRTPSAPKKRKWF